MSIAVLRAFISKRKQEHEEYLLKKAKGAKKASENDSSEMAVEEVDNKTPPEDHKLNGKCELAEETSPGESCTTMEGSVKIDEECGADAEQVDDSEGKRPAELEPPRVLEVPFAPLDILYITHLCYSSITITIVNSIPDLTYLLSLQVESEIRLMYFTIFAFSTS